MAIIGSLRVANFTLKRRREIISTVLPVEDGVLLPPAGSFDTTGKPEGITGEDNSNVIPLYVQNPLVGDSSTDRRIQWTNYGPLYKSGYCRTIRIQFIADLEVGQIKSSRSDGILHPIYGGGFDFDIGKARRFNIIDIPDVDTTFVFNSDVDTSTIFKFTVPLEFPELLQGPTVATVTTECIFTLFDGFFKQKRDPVTGAVSGGIRSPSIVIDADPLSPTEASVLTLRGTSRIYPEFQGGVVNKIHSFYVHWIAEFGHDCPYVKLTLSYGNSFITKDVSTQPGERPNPRRRERSQRLAGPIKLQVQSFQTDHDFFVYPLHAGQTGPRSTTDLGNGKWELVLHDDSLGDPKNFDVGYSGTVELFLYYKNTASAPLAIFETTRQAYSNSDGSADITPVSIDWFDRPQCYGPYGVVVDRPGASNIPANSFISNDTEAFEEALNLAFLEMRDYTNPQSDPWQKSIHGLNQYPADPGSQNFNQQYWHIVTTGAPDLRAIKLSMYQEAKRPHHYVEENGLPFEALNHTKIIEKRKAAGVDVGRKFTDCIFWEGGPWLVNKSVFPNTSISDALGVDTNNADRKKHQNWEKYRSEHVDYRPFVFAAILTGSKWALFWEAEFLASQALCTKNNIEDASIEFASPWRNATWWYQSPRSEARWASTNPHIYCVLPKPELIQHYQDRYTNLWNRPEQEFPILKEPPPTTTGNYGFFNKEISAVMYYQGGRSSLLVDRKNLVSWQEQLPYQAYGLVWLQRNTQAQWLDTAGYADGIETLLKRLARTTAFSCQYRNTFSGNLWKNLHEVDVESDPNQVGQNLPDAITDRHHNCYIPRATGSAWSKTNFNTGFPWTMFNGRSWFPWYFGNIFLGYDWAAQDNDLAWQERCALLLNFRDRVAGTGDGYDFPGDNGTAHRGWEKYPENRANSAAVVPNTFRERLATTIEMAAHMAYDFSGFPNDIEIEGGLGVSAMSYSFDYQGILLEDNGPGFEFIMNPSHMAYNWTVGGSVLEETDPVVELTSAIAYNWTVASTITQINTSELSSAMAYSFSYGGLLTAELLELPLLVVDAIVQTDLTITARDPMPTVNQVIEVWQGNSYNLRVPVRKANGDPKDISGATTIEFVIKPAVGDTSNLVFKSLGGDITILDKNTYNIFLDETDWENLSGDKYMESRIVLDGLPSTTFTGLTRINDTAL